MGEGPKTITIDMTEPKIRDSMTALEHIQTAMNLLNKNEGPWSSLAQAKTNLEKQIGTMLFYRARGIAAKESGT